MKMNKKDLFALMGKLDDRYIAASAYIAEGGEDMVYERPARRRAAAFFQSGWFVAILCAVVSLSVVSAMVWAGRQEPAVVPPTGATEQESGLESLHEDVHIEKETAIDVIEKQKVVISTVNCLGQPYKVSFYLPYQYKGGFAFTSNITLEDSRHYIESQTVPPTIDQLTFNTSEYIIALYREYIDSATIHVGFEATEYQCIACQAEVSKPIYMDGNQVTVTARACNGQKYDIVYYIKQNVSQITDSNHNGYPSGVVGMTYYTYDATFIKPSNPTTIFTNSIDFSEGPITFFNRQDVLLLANTLVDAVVHVEYDKEQRLCKACGETAPITVAITNNSAVVATRDCQGNVCMVPLALHVVYTPQYSSRTYEVRFSLSSNLGIVFRGNDLTKSVYYGVTLDYRTGLSMYLKNTFSQATVHADYDETSRICAACGQFVDDKKDLPDIDSVQNIKITYHANVDKTITVTDPTVISNILTFISEGNGEMGESTKGHYGTAYSIEIVCNDGTPSYTFNLWNSTHYSTPQYKDEDGYEYFFDADMSDMYEYLNEKYPAEFWYPD